MKPGDLFPLPRLTHEQQEIRTRIVKMYGVLGQLSPDSKELEKAIRPTGISNTMEARQNLKLWEILELFLSAIEKRVTMRDFTSFLDAIGMSKITAQAINSALKTHPKLFDEISEGDVKFLVLRERGP